MNVKSYNLSAYILGCTSLIGSVQYPKVPLLWWIIIGLASGLLFVYSNSKEQEKKLTFLSIDVANLIILAILVQVLHFSFITRQSALADASHFLYLFIGMILQ
jgi:cell division protein FtsW (lipid II flippase)